MVPEIAYRESVDGLRPDQLGGFFQDPAWPDPPTPETHLRLLRGSDHVGLAIDEESGRVVGFVTAVSDGVLSAYIPLLEVLPAYRGRGIGRALMRHLLDRLQDLYMVDLVCDPELEPFYARLGLRPAHAMIRRNVARQSGA